MGMKPALNPRCSMLCRLAAERGVAEFGFPPSPLPTPNRLKPAALIRYLITCPKRRQQEVFSITLGITIVKRDGRKIPRGPHPTTLSLIIFWLIRSRSIGE